MEVLNHKYIITNRKVLFLFAFFELLLITTTFLLHHASALILLVVLTFLILNFWDVKITLWFLIAFSTMVVYYHGLISVIMMLTLSSALIIVYLAAYFRFCTNTLKIKKTHLNLPIAIFLGIVCFQALRGILSTYPLKWLGTELLAYLSFGVVFLVVNLCDKMVTIKKFFQLLVLVAYYQAIIGLWNYFQVGHRIGGYLFGGFPGLIALVLLNLSFYSKEKSKKRTYILISLPLLFHLLFSFTRGFWLGFMCALLFSYCFYLSNSDYSFSTRFFKFAKATIILTVVILVLGFSIQHFFFGSLFSRVGKRFISSFSTRLSPETASNFERLIEYKACWERIKDKPILGYGIGYINSFKDPITKRRIDRWAVHQFYLMVTLKMGLIGLFAFLWIFYVFLRKGLNESKRIKNVYYKGLSFGFIANSVQLLIISFTNHEFASVPNTFYLAFTLGGVLVITSQNALSSKEKDS